MFYSKKMDIEGLILGHWIFNGTIRILKMDRQGKKFNWRGNDSSSPSTHTNSKGYYTFLKIPLYNVIVLCYYFEKSTFKVHYNVKALTVSALKKIVPNWPAGQNHIVSHPNSSQQEYGVWGCTFSFKPAAGYESASLSANWG